MNRINQPKQSSKSINESNENNLIKNTNLTGVVVNWSLRSGAGSFREFHFYCLDQKLVYNSKLSIYPTKSRSENINVLFTSKPQAMMSFAFSYASLWASSNFKFFHKNFSSSVNWITRGTSNASCKYLKQFDIFGVIMLQANKFDRQTRLGIQWVVALSPWHISTH